MSTWNASWDAKCAALASALQTTPEFVASMLKPLVGEPSAEALNLLIDPRYVTDAELKAACKKSKPGLSENTYDIAVNAVRAQRTQPQNQNQALLLALALGSMSQPKTKTMPENGAPKKSTDWSTVHRIATFDLATDDDRYTFAYGCDEGDICDVFLGKSEKHPEELIALKVARKETDADLLLNEEQLLKHIATVATGNAAAMSKLFPRLIASVDIQTQGGTRRANILSFHTDETPHAHGYVSLQEVMRAYPHGVEVKAFAWMFRRLFETLGWLHHIGLVHGAVVPGNILVHPQTHGIVLLDWCYARHTSSNKHLIALDATYKSFYPAEVYERYPMTSALDIYCAAMCSIGLLGGNVESKTLPDNLPAGIEDELHVCLLPIHKRPTDPWRIYDAMSAIFRRHYGKPHYTVFTMPVRG